MTAQVSDKFLYRRRNYTFLESSHGAVFNPGRYCLEPVGTSTNCYRGYHSHFAIMRSHLVLRQLKINLFLWSDRDCLRFGPPVLGPTINKVKPRGRRFYEPFNNYYEDLNLHLDYTGGVLIVDDPHPTIDLRGDFHPAWEWRNVVELTFDNGKLVDEFDRTEQLEAIRNECIEEGVRVPYKKKVTQRELGRRVANIFERHYADEYHIQ